MACDFFYLNFTDKETKTLDKVICPRSLKEYKAEGTIKPRQPGAQPLDNYLIPLIVDG